MTWFATFQCLNCHHSWREPAPADVWEMACKVASKAVCPLCGAQMRDGRVELLSHRGLKLAVVGSCPHIFAPANKQRVD